MAFMFALKVTQTFGYRFPVKSGPKTYPRHFNAAELPPRFDRITLLSAMPGRNPTDHRESTMLIRLDLFFTEVMSEMYA